MKWVTDSTGRFAWRPDFTQDEIDSICEQAVLSFLKTKHGEFRLPISTGDLTVLIEQDASFLDLYADLSGEGKDVRGLTDFFAYRKPSVRVARELSLVENNYHHLRSTLAHEYAHIKLHSFLWETELRHSPASKMNKEISVQRRKYQKFRDRLSVVHHSDRYPPTTDWMEWQASYGGRAILMPLSILKEILKNTLGACGRSWLPIDSDEAYAVTADMAKTFDVSHEMAKYRLVDLGILQNLH